MTLIPNLPPAGPPAGAGDGGVALNGSAIPERTTFDPKTLSLGIKRDAAEVESASPPNRHQRRALRRISLRGKGAELTENAIKAEPLLGPVALRGEVTIWYAKPNTGKTLLALALVMDAIEQKRIDGDDVVYVAMDDNSAGLAEKVTMLEDYGIHVIAPGHQGFEASQLMPLLNEIIAQKEASGLLVIVDTAKKVADLMDKRKASVFGNWARLFAMAGGTLLALAHTNKKPGADGKPVYAGTSDTLEDTDCAFILAERPERTDGGRRIVEFTNIKHRGSVADRAVYSYDDGGGVSYSKRLASIAEINAESFQPLADMPEPDQQKIAGDIVGCILSSVTQKMAILGSVMASCKVSRRKVEGVLDDWTGRVWDFEVKAKGAKEYKLLPPPEKAARETT